MKLVQLSAIHAEPKPAEIAAREERWLQAIREGCYTCEWKRVGDALWSTAIKIEGLRIALSYRSAIEAAKILDARLPTQVEADAMFAVARHIEPVVVRPVSASIDAIYAHSNGVMEQMLDAGPGGDGCLVDNEGKLWIAGAPAGRAWNYGWPDPGAPHALGGGRRGWQPLGAAHWDSHVDYSQTLRVVRDAKAPCSHEEGPGTPAPPPPASPAPTALGQRGEAVLAWQWRLIAEGYDPGVPDGIHGPRTEAATVAWRADHDLRDTVPEAEMPMGEPPIVTTGAWGARPAPVQATRDTVGIVIHHMALGAVGTRRGTLRVPGAAFDAELAAAKLLARNIQASHQARGWVDTGQHFSVSRGGIILEGRTGSLAAARRGLVVRGAHAGSAANSDHWGIEVEGDYTAGSFYGDTTPEVPEAQWRALVALVAWLCRVGGISVDAVRGHRQIPGNATGCPGTLLDRLPELRAAVRGLPA